MISRLSEDDLTDINLVSTQMQGRLEDFNEVAKEEGKVKKAIESIQKFKRNEITPNCSLNLQNILKRATKNKSTRKPKRGTGVAKKEKKIKSLTSLMQETYSNGKTFKEIKKTNAGQKDIQLSIFQYFSGNKEKIADILKRIEDVENSESINSTFPSDRENLKILYSKKEWTDIIRSIKLRFPKLSSRTKKSLKYITGKIQYQNQSQNLDDVRYNSLWSQASAPPDTDLTEEDLKWLYDLSQVHTDDDKDDEDVSSQEQLHEDLDNGSPFVMTLSQVMNAAASDNSFVYESDIILDSSPEPSPLKCNSLAISKRLIDQSPIPVNRIQVKNSIYNPTHGNNEISSHQQDSVETTATIESFPFIQETFLPSKIDNSIDKDRANYQNSNRISNTLTIVGTRQLPIELPSSNSKCLPKSESYFKSNVDDEVVIMSSPIKNSKQFDTPTRLSPKDGMNQTPLYSKFSPVLIRSDTVTQIKLLKSTTPEQEIVRSENSSAYSTAKSRFKFSLAQHRISPYHLAGRSDIYGDKDDDDDDEIFASMPVRLLDKKRKKYRTSRVTINGGISITDSTHKGDKVTVKKIETHHMHIDPETEIVDSEDEEGHEKSISIIEITREMDDTDELINLGRQDCDKCENHGTSILQVPSSPQIDNSNVLEELVTEESTNLNIEFSKPGELESLKVSNDFDTMSARELKSKFQEWGLKPVKGKEKMVQILTEASKLIDHTQFSDRSASISESQYAAKAGIFNSISEQIKSNQYWFDKVLSFEPINLDRLQEWLQSATIKINLERNLLEKYCDELGIAYTDTL